MSRTSLQASRNLVETLESEANEAWLAEQRARPLLERLTFAAYTRCACGAGLAYDPAGPSGDPYSGAWECSAILLRTAIPSGQPGAKTHTLAMPFLSWELLSENQPSAHGATTRPSGEE